MSNRARDRARIVQKIVNHQLTHVQAAEHLHLCVRQVKRLVSRYRAEGETGLVSRRRGVPASNRISASVRHQYMTLVRERYGDCGPSLTHEKLVAIHGFSHSVETLRHWMIEDGIWTPRERDNASPTEVQPTVLPPPSHRGPITHMNAGLRLSQHSA